MGKLDKENPALDEFFSLDLDFKHQQDNQHTANILTKITLD